MERAPAKRSAHHRAQAQKSHRRSGPPIGSGSVACAHRPAHTAATGISNLKNHRAEKKERRFEGNSSFAATWSVRGTPEVLTCPAPVHATGAARRIRLGAASTLPLQS